MKMHLIVLCMVLCVTMTGPSVTNTSFAGTTDRREFQKDVAVTDKSFAVTGDRSKFQTKGAVTNTSVAVTTDRSEFQTEVASTDTPVVDTADRSEVQTVVASTDTSFAGTTDRSEFQTEVALTNTSSAGTKDRSEFQTEVASTDTSVAFSTDRSEFHTEVAVTNTSVAVTTNIISFFHSFLTNASQTRLLNDSMSSNITSQLILSKESIYSNAPYSSVLTFEGKLTERSVVKIVQLQENYCKHKSCVLNTRSGNQSDKHFGHTERCFIFCEQCSCNISNCQDRRVCCPELFAQVPVRDEISSQENHPKECVYTQLKLESRNLLRYNLLGIEVIATCPNEFSININYSVSEQSNNYNKCVNSEHFKDLQSKIPVSNKFGNVTFLNRYCAYCNGLSDSLLQHWTPFLHCYSPENVFLPYGNEYLEEQIRRAYGCNIHYLKPDGVKTIKCQKKISTCNETGEWLVYDPVIDVACQLYNAEVRFSFKNIFCFLCNANYRSIHNQSCNNRIEKVSFSAILNFNDHPNTQEHTAIYFSSPEDRCAYSELYDLLQDRCLRIECIPPKMLLADTCKNVFESFAGYNYQFFLKLSPIQNVKFIDRNFTDGLAQSVASFLLDWFNKNLTSLDVSYFMIHSKEQSSSSDQLAVQYFAVHIILQTYVDKLTDMSHIDHILDQHGTTMSIVYLADRINVTIDFYVTLDNFILNLTNIEKTTRFILIDHNDNVTLTMHHCIILPRFYFFYLPSVEYNVLLPLHKCKVVILNSTFYHIYTLFGGIFVQEFDQRLNINAYIPAYRYIGATNESNDVFVCVETFTNMSLTLNKTKTSRFFDTNNIKGLYTSLSLTCVSIICLLINILVVSCTEGLRSKTSVNKICLSVSLVVSQAVLQYSFESSSGDKPTCEVICFTVHYFWMVTVLWTSINIFHVGSLFKPASLSANNTSSFKYICVRCIFSVLLAFVPVILRFIVASSSSGILTSASSIDRENPAERPACFIDCFGSLTAAVPLGLPVAAILLTNMSYVILVLSNVKKLSDLANGLRKERAFLIIFGVISFLTFSLWLFLFLFLTFAYEAFQISFLTLNVSHGVLLLLASVRIHFIQETSEVPSLS